MLSSPSAEVRVPALDEREFKMRSILWRSPSTNLTRFFETEAVIGLAMLLSRYKITIKEEAEFAHETFEETKARVLSSKAGLTVT